MTGSMKNKERIMVSSFIWPFIHSFIHLSVDVLLAFVFCVRQIFALGTQGKLSCLYRALAVIAATVIRYLLCIRYLMALVLTTSPLS